MWGKKPRTESIEIPDDIHEAKSMRARASEDLLEAQSQGVAITRLSSYLSERRQLNHFGESIQITFTRRGHA